MRQGFAALANYMLCVTCVNISVRHLAGLAPQLARDMHAPPIGSAAADALAAAAPLAAGSPPASSIGSEMVAAHRIALYRPLRCASHPYPALILCDTCHRALRPEMGLQGLRK